MTVLQIKVSTATGHVPTGLANGQMAINIADGILFWNNSVGALQSFNFASPLVATLGGTDSSTHAANTSFVQSIITALINNAPASLNTLGEIAAAINNDPVFYQTLNNILTSCIRYDVSQTLNGPALAQVQANIGLTTSIINGQIQRSLVSGVAPASLLDGQLFLNEADELFFYKNSSGTIRSFGLPAPLEMQSGMGLQVNGNMEYDRQNLGGNVVIPNNVMTYAIDQWQFGYVHTANTAAFATKQFALTGLPIGGNLINGLQATATPALSPSSSGDYAIFQQPIEGYRWEKMNYGLANAMPVTIGLWVFATATGIASVVIRNSALTRSYVANFTVAASNTWQWVAVTIPGDIAGTWFGGFNTSAIIGFCFNGGVAYQTPANAWATGNFMASSANTNFYGSSSNKVIISGVVILPGSNMPPVARTGLLHRSSDEELRLVTRYWESGVQPVRFMPFGSGVTQASDSISFAPKRVNPSISLIGFEYYSNGVPAIIPNLSIGGIYADHFEYIGQSMSNWQGWYNTGIWTANARM